LAKPSCYPSKYAKGFAEEILLIDDSEYITLLIGSQVKESLFLSEVFGVNNV